VLVTDGIDSTLNATNEQEFNRGAVLISDVGKSVVVNRDVGCQNNKSGGGRGTTTTEEQLVVDPTTQSQQASQAKINPYRMGIESRKMAPRQLIQPPPQPQT